MNEERDPITEWEHAIERRIGGAAVVCMLIVVVGAMVAPLFGWAIKTQLYRYYALEDDCEQRVAKKMKSVWIGLWLLAFMAWAFVIACNAYGYSTQ
jgi:Mn2+/Fe2+ NRAMP family transporter